MGAPIPNTCPDIDKAIKELQPLVKTIYKMKEYEYEDIDTVKDLLSNCRYAMDCAIDAFEDLRKANDTLRSWGKEMEEEAETLQVQVDELKETIGKLEEQIEELNPGEETGINMSTIAVVKVLTVDEQQNEQREKSAEVVTFGAVSFNNMPQATGSITVTITDPAQWGVYYPEDRWNMVLSAGE